MKRSEKKLGEILTAKGLIKAGQLANALAEQKTTKEFLGAILIKHNYIRETDLLKALAEQFNIGIIDAGTVYIDWDVVKQFSPSLILQDKCFPFRKDESSITVAIINPLDAWSLKKAEDESGGVSLKYVLVSPAGMEELAQRYRQYMRGIIFGKLEEGR